MTCLLGPAVSCKKYLEEKSNNSLVVPTTIADLQALLDDGYIMNTSTPMYAETVSDNYFATDDMLNSQDEVNRNAYCWLPVKYTFQNDWSAAYTVVYNSNLCLERIEQVERNGYNESDWNNVKGSALFFRAYSFLNLAWTYAKAYDPNTYQTDLGIVLRLGSNFNVKSQRANVKDSYDQIIADAKNAVKYLPDQPKHVLRPSRAAAYGLLARAYLSMGKADSSLKYSNLCLGIKNTLMDYNNPSQVNINNSYPFSKFNAETVFYTEARSYSLYIQYNGLALADTTLFASYADHDLRKKAYFEPNGNYQNFNGHYSNNDEFFTGIATDEMYLTRAESYARIGLKDQALADLNTLLLKRWDNTFSPFTAPTSNDALKIVLTERRKELLNRGLRWMDIKRLNKENADIIPKRVFMGQSFTLSPNGDRYALPLPTDIVELGVTQNPGW